jgi:hypothetical protein
MAPPLREVNGKINPALAVQQCAMSGRLPKKFGLDQRVDAWYDELRSKGVGEPWSDLKRVEYGPRRTAFNFYACLCYAQLLSNRADSRELFTNAYWQTLGRGGVSKWGLPDAKVMAARLANYPVIDVEHLTQTICGAALAFNRELEGTSKSGSDNDRLAVVTYAMAIFAGELTGLLGTFGKEADEGNQVSGRRSGPPGVRPDPQAPHHADLPMSGP